MRKTIYYCDFCGNEMQEPIRGNIILLGGKDFGVELKPFAPPDSNMSPANFEENMHICKHCIIDAVKRWDDRPQPG